MRTVDLIHNKRDGGELTADEISYLVESHNNGSIPDYQVSAFLMAVFFSGMTDREVSALTDSIVRTGETVDLSSIPGPKVDKHSTGGVGDKTSLIAAPLAGGGRDRPQGQRARPGAHRRDARQAGIHPRFPDRSDRRSVPRSASGSGLVLSSAKRDQVAPADGKLYALRDVTATVDSIPLIASSIMSKKLTIGSDALVLDVKVGAGAFMKRQVDARKLAQMMVGIGRRVDRRVQALITDMSQPLGYAVGNAVEIMEVSQVLHNEGPDDLKRLSLELAARMIFLAKLVPTLDDARELALQKLADGSAFRKFCDVVKAQGGDPKSLDKFELLPNATGMREISSPRAGYVTAINAEDIGAASGMMGAGTGSQGRQDRSGGRRDSRSQGRR